MSEPRPLHRLFGLFWMDFFQGTTVSVETELDLSLKAESDDPTMPDKLKEFVRETIDQLLIELPPEKRLEGLCAEEVVRALPPETREAVARLLKANGPAAKPQ